jgi:hypothetical protein
MTQQSQLTLFKYDLVSDKIEWTAIRKGETIAQGSAKNFMSAKIIAEQFVINKYNSEKIFTKALLGQGENQLFIMSSTK